MTIWNLDKNESYEAKRFLQSKGYDKNTHANFAVNETIVFYTGYNNDILASATIKGINGDNLYVYNDCYWFPIQDDSRRKIKKLNNVEAA